MTDPVAVQIPAVTVEVLNAAMLPVSVGATVLTGMSTAKAGVAGATRAAASARVMMRFANLNMDFPSGELLQV